MIKDPQHGSQGCVCFTKRLRFIPPIKFTTSHVTRLLVGAYIYSRLETWKQKSNKSQKTGQIIAYTIPRTTVALKLSSLGAGTGDFTGCPSAPISPISVLNELDFHPQL
jgi:hypothetical protein